MRCTLIIGALVVAGGVSHAQSFPGLQHQAQTSGTKATNSLVGNAATPEKNADTGPVLPAPKPQSSPTVSQSTSEAPIQETKSSSSEIGVIVGSSAVLVLVGLGTFWFVRSKKIGAYNSTVA